MLQSEIAGCSSTRILSFSTINGIGHAIKGVTITGQSSGESKFLVLFTHIATDSLADGQIADLGSRDSVRTSNPGISAALNGYRSCITYRCTAIPRCVVALMVNLLNRNIWLTTFRIYCRKVSNLNILRMLQGNRSTTGNRATRLGNGVAIINYIVVCIR